MTEPQPCPGGAQSAGYSDANYCGVHLYQFNYSSDMDLLRVEFGVKRMQELWHKPLWIDELGIVGGMSNTDEMADYLRIADTLLAHPLGQRIVALPPFVSSGNPGNPPSWDGHYIIRDPATYELLGDRMTR